MNKLISVYKPAGVTPLELVKMVRNEMPGLENEKIGYAGRLDPLAHGVMLLMVGDAAKERDIYLVLKKQYTFEVLFGVETDTYDILGLVPKKEYSDIPIVNKNVSLFVNKHLGSLQLPYPPYSSKAVNGKPLFWWARNNRLSEIEIPIRNVNIDTFEILNFRKITKNDLQKKVKDTIANVKGDFRQEEIIRKWDEFFKGTNVKEFETATFDITCSSGTYVRGIVHELGQFLGTGAIALDIFRTKVGEYDVKDSIQLSSMREMK